MNPIEKSVAKSIKITQELDRLAALQVLHNSPRASYTEIVGLIKAEQAAGMYETNVRGFVNDDGYICIAIAGDVNRSFIGLNDRSVFWEVTQ